MTETITITCQDNYPLSAHFFKATKPKGTVIIASAIGVTQGYYHRFAGFLSECGYNTITFDYRDTGNSISQHHSNNDLASWGCRDLEAVINYCEPQNLPLFFIGHSIGGQIVGLAKSSTQFKSMVFIASAAPYWKRWSFPQNLKILASTRMIFPLFTAVKEEFPAKAVGLGNQNLPSTLVKQWAKWMSKPDYLFDTSFNLDTSNYKDLQQTLLFMGFTDDPLAPQACIEKLMTFYPNADKTLNLISPSSINHKAIGHTGFFRSQFKDSLWVEVLSQLNSQLDKPSA